MKTYNELNLIVLLVTHRCRAKSRLKNLLTHYKVERTNPPKHFLIKQYSIIIYDSNISGNIENVYNFVILCNNKKHIMKRAAQSIIYSQLIDFYHS